jgi:HSP20 family protein
MSLPVRRRDTAPRPVQRWDPFRELEGLQDQLAQLMQRAQPDGDGGVIPFVPLVDIEETEDAWIVEAELPGVRPEDVNVEVRGSELAISGEIKEREREGILRRRMRKTGEFDYHITLPGDADPEQIEAKLHDGILSVRIAKPEQERPRRIDVKAE